MSSFFQNRGAVTTVANATLGLMAAIQLKKRRKGKYALMPSFTFPATALAAIWCVLCKQKVQRNAEKSAEACGYLFKSRF